MYSSIYTAVVSGIDSKIVRVEADISEGMPIFSMVGFLSSEVKEAKERVRTALKNIGLHLPTKRITINISPASIKKNGTSFDLPIAISVMQAMGVIVFKGKETEDFFFAGELGLDGSILPVNGILPMVLSAKESGKRICVIPKENITEASLVPGIEVIGVNDVKEAIIFLNEGTNPGYKPNKSKDIYLNSNLTDFSDINGMPFLRRTCEIAVSGMHNLLMVGPPGAGKTFISKALPTILPPLTEEEKLELSKIYSVCGLFKERNKLVDERPFRNPHHTISEIGLVGGGNQPRPGEISLSHKGILFLDELLEFKRQTIEILRQPLEDGFVNIVRSSGEYTFPADFMLVGAMNPCPCGYYPDYKKCTCTPRQIKAYLSKLSRPIVDRIDICVDVPSVQFGDIKKKEKNESSESIRERVTKIHMLQRERFKNESFSYNSEITPGKIDKYCKIGNKEEEYIKEVFDKLSLTARSFHKLLKVARTIADMDGKNDIELVHIKEAVRLRLVEGESINGCI